MTISHSINSQLIQEIYRCWVELKNIVAQESSYLCFASLSNKLDEELKLFVRNWKLVTRQIQESVS